MTIRPQISSFRDVIASLSGPTVSHRFCCQFATRPATDLTLLQALLPYYALLYASCQRKVWPIVAATSYNALALELCRLSWFYPQLRVDVMGYTHPLRTEMWSLTSDAASWSFKGHVLTNMCSSFCTPGKTSEDLPVCSCQIHDLK